MRTADVQGVRVLLDARDLRLRLGVAAELERDQHLVESAAGVRVFDGGGRFSRAEWCERGEVEIGALPEVGDDGPQHRELLVGGTAVDVDGAEQRPGHRLDEFGGDEERHRERIIVQLLLGLDYERMFV